MKFLIPVIFAITWTGLWLTPDQQAQRLFRRKHYQQAAETFIDPLWKGTAWYRAGQFQKAIQAFSRSSTAEAHFNTGNAWMLLGKYQQAIDSYQQALTKRAGWTQAADNLAIAQVRAKRIQQQGGDAGDQKLGADKIVFDKKKPGGQNTETDGKKGASAAAVQAIWLRQVQTRPADFLKAKFAWQEAQSKEGVAP